MPARKLPLMTQEECEMFSKTTAIAALLFMSGWTALAQGRLHPDDRNGDGAISRSEWRGDPRSFRDHDINRDGVLSGTEIPRARGDSNEGSGNQESLRVGKLDKNRSGVVEGYE